MRGGPTPPLIRVNSHQHFKGGGGGGAMGGGEGGRGGGGGNKNTPKRVCAES